MCFASALRSQQIKGLRRHRKLRSNSFAVAAESASCGPAADGLATERTVLALMFRAAKSISSWEGMAMLKINFKRIGAVLLAIAGVIAFGDSKTSKLHRGRRDARTPY